MSNKKRHKFIEEEQREAREEKREAKSIKQKILKRVNKHKEILSKDKILGRTKGKFTHGARGNKNE